MSSEGGPRTGLADPGQGARSLQRQKIRQDPPASGSCSFARSDPDEGRPGNNRKSPAPGMERRLRCGMKHACTRQSPAPFSPAVTPRLPRRRFIINHPFPERPQNPPIRPILYHSGQFSGNLGQKVWAAGIVFILLPSIFRTPQCGQYKPNQYVMKKIFLRSGRRCHRLRSIRRRISGKQPLLEAERYGPCRYSHHETQLR